MHTATLQRAVRWTALITGSLLLIFLVWMLVGHLTGNANGPNGMRFGSMWEVFTFFLFPICTILGLALAYKWELIGGAVVVVSIALPMVLRPDLAQGYFAFMGAPGVLYILSGWLARRR